MTDRNLDTPYEGIEFDNWPRYTILRGSVVWANGEVKGRCGAGKYLKRGPSQLGRTYPANMVDPRNVAHWLEDNR
jgi:dihydropyrimidinase